MQTWNRLLIALAGSLSLFLLVYFVFIDFSQSKAASASDFISTFYVAGDLVALHQANMLYPPADTSTFATAPFNVSLHRILPWENPAFSQVFLYMPLVADFFEPFSLMPSHVALLVWQAISFAALALSAWLLAKCCGSHTRKLAWLVYPLTFLPIAHVLWQGQMSIVFGVLPISLAYVLLRANRTTEAALILPLTLVKPQFFIYALFITLSQLLARRFRFVAYFAAGTAAIIAANIAAFGWVEFTEWLKCLRIADHIYANANFAPWFTISMPRQILFNVPIEYRDSFRPIIYAVCGTLSLIAAFLAWKVQYSSLSMEHKVSIIFLIGATLAPLVIPHFFIYDLTMLMPTAFILLCNQVPEPMAKRLKPPVLFLWIAFGLYAYIAVFHRTYAQPLIMVIFLGEFARRSWSETWQCVRNNSPAAPSTIA